MRLDRERPLEQLRARDAHIAEDLGVGSDSAPEGRPLVLAWLDWLREHEELEIGTRTVRALAALMTALAAIENEPVSDAALKFVNRLSDFFFVASRWVNAKHDGDVLWQPGKSQQGD